MKGQLILYSGMDSEDSQWIAKHPEKEVES